MDFIVGNHICGLYYTIGTNFKRIYLPQAQLTSHTTVNPVCFTTNLTQTFQNPNSEALSQARYVFPLFDGVAVSGYTISYASKVLKGVVKQKDDAKKTYQEAIDRGETAGLLESLPAGVFGVTLGNVPAKTDVVVEISYCGELKHDAAIDGLRYNLPTSIAPRYGNYPGELLKANTAAKGGISITVDVDMAGSAVRKIQSPSHPISVSMGATSLTEGSNTPFLPSQASATLTLGTAELGGDFILQLLVDDINRPQAILETHPTIPNQRALMTTLVPKFTLDPIHPEIVFIADQSGSMRGSNNDALKTALGVFLKSLPIGVRFNICAFGSSYTFLWPKSQAYNEDNLNKAISFVQSFTAGYGGTEILQPITATFEQRLADLPLEVMLLTDGRIWGEAAVFTYINHQIREKGADARVFALGVGSDVSHTLIEGVARAGNGFAQFVTQNEDTDQKVVRMLKGALYAHTKDYELEVHYDEKGGEEMNDDDDNDDFEIVEKVNDCLKISEEEAATSKHAKTTSFFDASADLDKPIAKGDKNNRYAHLPALDTPKIVQAPNTIPPLFPFNRSSAYLLFAPDSTQKRIVSVTLRAMSAQGPLELNIPVYESSFGKVATIHQLAARKAIQDLEEGRGWIQAAKTANNEPLNVKHASRMDELAERECVRLGEMFQVAAKWTSFVAVDAKHGKEERIEEQIVESEQEEEVEGLVHERRRRLMVNPLVTANKRKVASPQVAAFSHAALQSYQATPRAAGFGQSVLDAGAQQPQPEQVRFTEGYRESKTRDRFRAEMASAQAMSLPDENYVEATSSFGSTNTGFGGTSLFGNQPSRARTSGGGFGQGSGALFGGSAQASGFGDVSTHSSGPFGGGPAGAAFGSTSQNLQEGFGSASQQVGGRFGGFGGASKPSGGLVGGGPFGGAAPRSDVSAGTNAQVGFEQASAHSASQRFGPFGGFGTASSNASARSSYATDTMHSLISLQNFSGAWAWNEQLFAVLGINEEGVSKNHLGGQPDVCATVLAVAFLETQMPFQRGVWEMVVAKAKTWLVNQIFGNEDTVKALLTKAAVYF